MPPYEDRCRLIDLEILSRRRKNAAVFFVFDLLTGHIDASNLLSLYNLNVPHRMLRVRDPLNVRYHRTNYGIFGPVRNTSAIFNEISMFFDYGISRECFRKSIRSSSRS